MIRSPHTFHIPVMGLAFTIDTPIKVARFGINSVISIIQDNLIEKMREHYYKQLQEPFNAIDISEEDYRAKRITDYLNLVNRIVTQQVEMLKQQDFDGDSELDTYFELLPDASELKDLYRYRKHLPLGEEKRNLGKWLKEQVVPGSIDVNIMTKLDQEHKDKVGNTISDGSNAVAALRGYMQSNLVNSSLILSAGMNPRLFAYMEKCEGFQPNAQGYFDKKIVIKVSDFRSAQVQGKMLAKRGLWVSEFRIESGLNCGGHAFATDGYLIGPILQEFKDKRQTLLQELKTIYRQALESKGVNQTGKELTTLITYQGGIGTKEEDSFLRTFYNLNGTGWGTPFLLVPEATTVDEDTIHKLCEAREKDIVLSKDSPLGVRFHNLQNTTAQQEKAKRILKGKPGSPCTEKFLQFNTEFTTEPICTASHQYQRLKLKHLAKQALGKEEYEKQVKEIVDKECLCVGLSNPSVKEYGLQPFKKMEGSSVCPGPGIAYFSKVVSLKTMIDHIYGRTSLVNTTTRPHVFTKELQLYFDYWAELTKQKIHDGDVKLKNYITSFYENLMRGTRYYEALLEHVGKEAIPDLEKVNHELKQLQQILTKHFEQFQLRINSLALQNV